MRKFRNRVKMLARRIGDPIKAMLRHLLKPLVAIWRNIIVSLVWAIAVTVLAGLGWHFWPLEEKLFEPMNKAESLRDIVLTVAAILGFPIVIQRAQAHDKQAKAAMMEAKSALLIFKKECAAASELSAYIESRIYGTFAPGMEWDDVVQGVACSFSSHEKWLMEFKSNYRAFLPQEIVDRLDKCTAHIHNGMECERDGSEFAAHDHASKFYDELICVRDQITSRINELTVI